MKGENMRRIAALLFSFILLCTAFASCAQVDTEKYSITSSSETVKELFLDRCADKITGDVVLASGTDAAKYADLSGFVQDDAYLIRRENNDLVIVAKNDDGLDKAVRYYANHFPSGGDSSYSYGEGYRVGKITIAGRDISEYSIVIPPNADYLMNFSAKELQKYLGLS